MRREALGSDLRGRQVAQRGVIVVGKYSTGAVATIAAVALDQRRREARGERRHLLGHGHRHRGDGEGRSGRHGGGGSGGGGDGGVTRIVDVLVNAVVIFLVPSEGARVAVGLAATLGEAGEGLRRPGTDSKLIFALKCAFVLRHLEN